MNQDNDGKNKPDSLTTIFGRDGQSESVNQFEREKTDSSKVKCPYCDYTEHPFYLKIHVQNAHEGGL
jgi:hypothetical protein